MAGPRRIHRKVGYTDIERALTRLSKSADEGEFYTVILAYWKYLCEEEPAIALWVKKQIETLVNQFPGISEASAFELLWKVLSFASSDMVAVEGMFLHGESYTKIDDGHAARVSGKFYV